MKKDLKDILFILVILFLIIAGWIFLYSKGKLDEKLPEVIKKETKNGKIKSIKNVIPVEQNNGIGDGAESLDKLLKKDKNKKMEEYKKTESGLEYKVIRMGDGKKPEATDVVEVHYEGKLEDGTIFDSSYARGEKISFPLNQVIPGWTEGLQLMPVGSEFEFKIPANLAYGDQALPGIPAGSTLIFKVELFDIKK